MRNLLLISLTAGLLFSNRETVIKKRMRLTDDGKPMNVELIPMVGTEQPGKLVFEKQ